MGNSNIGTLILYKQHYRDNYNNEASLPENQLFSTFGYYDGFKIIQEESNNTLKANCSVIEALYKETHKPINDLTGKYSMQIVGLFKINKSDNINNFISAYNSSVFAVVGFIQLNESCRYQERDSFNKKVSRFKVNTTLNMKIMGTFDNADCVVLAYSNTLAELNTIINQISLMDEVEYIHSILGISQSYLNTCDEKKQFLLEWNKLDCKLNEVISEFTIKIACKNKIAAIKKLYEIFTNKEREIGLSAGCKINECKCFDSNGQHSIELVFDNVPITLILLFMMPHSVLSHDNEAFGTVIYNIESSCKFNNISLVPPKLEQDKQQDEQADSIPLKLMKKIKTTFQSVEDPMVMSIYNSVNTVVQFGIFKMTDDIFYMVYPVIYNFLEQYKNVINQDDIYEEQIEEANNNMLKLVECINSVIQHSVHTDQMFLMIPGYSGSSYGLSTKLCLFYQSLSYSVSKLLEEQGHRYDILLSPEAKVKPVTREYRMGKKEHAIIVKFGQKMLFKSEFMIILVHELSHYIGESLRMRDKRTSDCIEIIAFLLADVLFSDIGYIYDHKERNSSIYNVVEQYKNRVSNNIKNRMHRNIEAAYNNSTQIYASDLEPMLSNEAYKILCLQEFDANYGNVFYRSDKWLEEFDKKDGHDTTYTINLLRTYCDIKDNIEEKQTYALFDDLADKIVSQLLGVYKEIFSDVSAYAILGFDFEQYHKAFNVSEDKDLDMDQNRISPVQTIREYVMHEIMQSKVQFNDKAIQPDDVNIVYGMFSYDFVKSKLLEYGRECYRQIMTVLKEDDNKRNIKREIRQSYELLRGGSIIDLYCKVLGNIECYKKEIDKKISEEPKKKANAVETSSQKC